MPMVLTVILCIWLFAVCLYNQAVCQAICQEALYKGCNEELMGRDGEAAARKTLSEQAEYLIGMSDVEMTARRRGDSLSVSLKGSIELFPMRLMGEGGHPLIVEAAAEGVWESPAEGIRKMRLLRRYALSRAWERTLLAAAYKQS